MDLLHASRGLAVLALSLALTATAPAAAPATAPAAAPATAPPAAVRSAVGTARARLHTLDAGADFSLLSERDRRWALVDGTARKGRHLWAAWLHRDGPGRWSVRYFDTVAPFRPQSTRRGRVPCDLYPAFAEAVCPPSGPSAAELRARLVRQLAPRGPAARLAAILRNGGYSFTFTPTVSGSLALSWSLADARRPTLVARGRADFFGGRPGPIRLTLSAAGRRALRGVTAARLIARATFTPILYADFSATRRFVLSR